MNDMALLGAAAGGAVMGTAFGLAFAAWFVHGAVWGRRRRERRFKESDTEYRLRMLKRVRWSAVLLLPVATGVAGAILGMGFYGLVLLVHLALTGGTP